MKTSLRLLALLVLAAVPPADAQNPLSPAQPRVRVNSHPSARAAADAGGDLKRLDLDFPGGTPGQLVSAISQALTQPLNAIIPNEQADTKIMPIKVVGVTVPELFSALESASSAERPVVTSGGGGSKNVQYRNVAMGFRPNTSNVTDTTVWSFYSNEPTAEFLAAAADAPASDQVCQYFQLAPYLEGHTIEDITTAIQTGWKMLKVEPLPQLSFHQETKLLIAVGLPQHVSQILAVLEQLQRDGTAAVEKITNLQAEVAQLEGAKEPGWEQKAEALKDKIARTAARQRARETIMNGPQRVPKVPQPGGR